ncbi:hypothetical protein BCR41DRAFT_401190 [Lobosporangium transversale]|uniref:F-box domain-containing protein n=1 Tax=Lobosporangium transversale TaxID=64571 RepID=A0A1Y2G8R1_9FUNG|nr:hypothetical protein BCR41DRAFT_401190 [Lobosporangium transversale]ORZ04333.1 hypothetical protein BCR41DRAFT_401190 [Lobosporangium transversale]|eukprot:XP_021876491.1 hypothetical protein BCR41DRAFT_401190 [Lobosporangium transversale]
MNNLILNPFGIPEILSLVGDYLDRSDLLHCIRVSKAFHNTLVKFIWKKIQTGSHSKEPTFEALQNYKEHIEELVFYNIFPQKFRLLQGCKRLKYINCSMRSSQDFSIPNDLSNLIKAHRSTITKFLFEFKCPGLQEIWGALMECTHLEYLKIYGSQISSDETDLFFQVCKKVKHLDMSHVCIHQLPSDFMDDNADNFIFPNINALYFHHTKISNPPHPYTSSYCLGMLTRRCPRLRSLVVAGNQYDFYREAFLYRPFALPDLSKIWLYNMKIKDEDMAALLKQLTELRQLFLQGSDFGPLSIRELLAEEQEILEDGHIIRKRRNRRLCDTVEILEFIKQTGEIDGVVQAILSNCPRLKELRGPKITLTEIIAGAEWISTGLTHMSVNLEVDVGLESSEGPQMQRTAFRQLGKLTQLRVLNLTPDYSWNEEVRTLDLRLRSGLDELVNLKRLFWLFFEGDKHQRMQSEDATWIINNWPSLNDVYGIVNCEPGARTLVTDILLSHDILVEYRTFD